MAAAKPGPDVPAPPTVDDDWYINTNAIDESLPDLNGDHVVVPPGAIVFAKRLHKTTLEKSQFLTPFKGDVKSKFQVLGPKK
jgi:hypothetical protein